MTSNRHRTIAVLAASLSLVWVAVPEAQVDSENVSPPLPDWLETWLLFENVGGNSVEFGTLDVPPIPPDFFGPGSDPFVGLVPFRGIPLDPGITGTASVEVVRAADPVLPEDPPGAMATVPIELVQLELRSVEPIIVTYGGGGPQLWDLDILLSEVTPPPGTLTATKTHPNGGTFDAEFNVQPLFRFIRLDDPDDQRIIDTGELALPPVHLAITGADFVHELGPGFTDLILTEFSQWHPGITEPVPGDVNSQVASPFTAISDGGGVEHTICPAVVKLGRCELVTNEIPNSQTECDISEDGTTYFVEFRMDARFRANCSCCEYRQRIKGEFKINGETYEHLLGPGEKLEKDTFHEDCKRTPHPAENSCYGHRSDPANGVGCTDDAYVDPNNRAIGCNYFGIDQPRLFNWPVGTVFSFNLDFEGKIIDTCNGTTLRLATWNATCSGTFFGPEPDPLFESLIDTTINGRDAILGVYLYPGDVLTVHGSIVNDTGEVPIDSSDVNIEVDGLTAIRTPAAGSLPQTVLRGAVAQAGYRFDYPPSPPTTVSVTFTFGPESQKFDVDLPQLCVGDVNGDGVVNVLDLLDLLGCFRQPAVPPCDTADLNGDGVVNVPDLIQVIFNFGPCP